MNKFFLPAYLFLCSTPAWAKDAGQAMADMQSVSDTDPNGFKWMIVCIGLLFLMAGSLIVATIGYGMKQKEGRNYPRASQANSIQEEPSHEDTAPPDDEDAQAPDSPV